MHHLGVAGGDTLRGLCMKTANLQTSTVTVGSPEMLQAVEPVARRDIGHATSEVFDGCPWTYRNGFDAVLKRVSAAFWGDPAQLGAECVKKNSARTVWRVTLDRRTYYLKYYFNARWLDVVKEWLRAPACAEEWRSGLYALRAGIATVPPAGFTTKLYAGGRRCALFVTEAIEPASPLNEFWATLRTDTDRMRRRADTARLIDELAALIARAHQAGFQHT
ncbi:MAG: hypothetical protein JXO22_05120, partial [Phycisphaerae bacterium]|nr:hypothetical protein [Phycisphaerae bacterium]